MEYIPTSSLCQVSFRFHFSRLKIVDIHSAAWDSKLLGRMATCATSPSIAINITHRYLCIVSDIESRRVPIKSEEPIVLLRLYTTVVMPVSARGVGKDLWRIRAERK